MKTRTFIKTGLLTLAMLAAGVQASAQFNCGTDQVQRQLRESDPGYAAREQAFREYMRRYIDEAKQQQRGNTPSAGPASVNLVIPVVFHIIHEYGAENISDAQVQDQVDILNRDYQKLNPDTASVIPPFQPLIADVGLEFRLARLDPDGNCTNGIERIYSHETRVGNDGSKLNPWPRNKYLNVWVVKSMANGVAGYAYYPSAVSQGFGYIVDGVIILSDYIGSIGTSSVSHARALTHEIGHYLGLPHVWGDNNNPGVECGDDGFQDTPVSKGWSSCPAATAPNYAQWRVCDTAVVENVQNYMEYSYCSKMFTPDQSLGMHASLNSWTSGRINLWQQANLVATGTDVTNYPPCVPRPDFTSDTRMICQGSSISYSDASWNAPASAYDWKFDGGAPLTSTSANPAVTYNTFGWYSTYLKTANASGADSIGKFNYVYVSPPWADYTGAFAEDFENVPFNFWIVNNPENNASRWQVSNTVGYSGTHALLLDAFGSDGAVRDEVITPPVDLSYTTSMTLQFKWSAATRTASDTIVDALKVYSSVDCGKTWTLRKTISGNALITAGYCGSAFVPYQQSLWASSSVTLPAAQVQSTRTRFRFEYTAGPYANNLYIDDINIAGIVGTGEAENHDFGMQLFPNPSGGPFTLSYNLVDEARISLTLMDAIGKTQVLADKEVQQAGTQQWSVDPDKLGLSPGLYFIILDDGHSRAVRKMTFVK